MFCNRTNTTVYDLRTSEDKGLDSVRDVHERMSIRGVAEVLKVKPLTMRRWIARASDHCEGVNEAVLKDVETPKVELDEIMGLRRKKESCR
ncbi:MAG: hypothetical protein ACYDHX_13100 [Methanothrix sp.]